MSEDTYDPHARLGPHDPDDRTDPRTARLGRPDPLYETTRTAIDDLLSRPGQRPYESAARALAAQWIRADDRCQAATLLASPTPVAAVSPAIAARALSLYDTVWALLGAIDAPRSTRDDALDRADIRAILSARVTAYRGATRVDGRDLTPIADRAAEVLAILEGEWGLPTPTKT